MSLVSIIIPTYNTEKYIHACIQSVLNQTYQNFEIIVVDDGSTDGSVEAVKQFDNSRIRVYQNEKNSGPSYSRNRAIELAKGEFIAILDSDDWWDPNRLKNMMKVMNEKDLDLIFDNLLYIREGERSPWTTYYKFKGITVTDDQPITPEYFVENDLGILKAIIRKTLITDNQIYYNEAIKYGEDFLFYLELITKTSKSWLLKEGYYYYLSREGSLVKNMFELSKECLRATEELLQHPKKEYTPGLMKALEKRAEDFSFVVRYHETDRYLKSRQYSKAIHNFIQYRDVLKEMTLVRLRLLKYALQGKKIHS
ncbi:glycosyltransferase family 2 protein [Niallia sp. XMNu-256]|uniref:glycosyltransferase family 2 protein n=1 Tax=Niallia sp. XMNu-256 TaxID=3082444 RepID=UPI0030CE10A9